MAKLSQLQPLLMIRFLRHKMTGLQHRAVVDEAPVGREEVGEVDIAEREVDGGMAEGDLTEIVVAGVVSDPSGRSLIRRLTYDLDSAYRGRGDGEFRGRGEGKERKPMHVIVDTDFGSCLSGYRGRGDGEWRGRGEGEEITTARSQLTEERLI